MKRFHVLTCLLPGDGAESPSEGVSRHRQVRGSDRRQLQSRRSRGRVWRLRLGASTDRELDVMPRHVGRDPATTRADFEDGRRPPGCGVELPRNNTPVGVGVGVGAGAFRVTPSVAPAALARNDFACPARAWLSASECSWERLGFRVWAKAALRTSILEPGRCSWRSCENAGWSPWAAEAHVDQALSLADSPPVVHRGREVRRPVRGW